MELDDEVFAPVTRLSKGFALRDLIAGAEFEIREDTCEDPEEQEFFNSKYSPSDVESYINFSALDLDTDENDKVISFSELREKMDHLTSDGKVMKLVKKSGIGSVVRPDSIVFIHYHAHVNLDEIPFDNSYLRKSRPERFKLGTGCLIPGLELGIRTMRKGEKSQFLIESEYAYGTRGCPPRIPPDATVLFEVELVNFTDCAAPDNPENLENIDRQSFAYIVKIAKENHLRGNECFNQKNEKAAVQRYKKAVDLLLSCSLKDEEEEAQQKKLLLKLYTNLSVCYLKLKHPERVCIVVREAIYVDEAKAKQNAKLLYNWGAALVILGEYAKAAVQLKAALKLSPNDKTIKDELTKLEIKKKTYAESEKIYFKKALGCESTKTNVTNETKHEEEVNEELLTEIKRSIEEAKMGQVKTLTLFPELVSRVQKVCRSLITEKDGLVVEKVDDKTIIIRNIKKN